MSMTESENIHATFEDAIYCAKSWYGEVACEECRLYPLGDIFCRDTSKITAQAMEELEQFGTVSEFRQLKEKATAKKPKMVGYRKDGEPVYECGCCGSTLAFADQIFCMICSCQVDWSEGKESCSE